MQLLVNNQLQVNHYVWYQFSLLVSYPLQQNCHDVHWITADLSDLDQLDATANKIVDVLDQRSYEKAVFVNNAGSLGHIGKALDVPNLESLRTAIVLAAMINEGTQGSELDVRIHYNRVTQHQSGQVKKAIEQLARRLKTTTNGDTLPRDDIDGLLSIAFPNWLAVNRGPGVFQLVSGQRIACATDHPFAGEKYSLN